MSRSEKKKIEYGTINLWTLCPKAKGVLECIFVGIRKPPIPPIAKLKVSDACQGNPKEFHCPYYNIGQGKYISKTLSYYNNTKF